VVFASATGNFAAGLIAAATGAEGASGADPREVVMGVYSTVGWTAIVVGVVMLVIAPLIGRLMHLETLRDDQVGLAGQGELAGPDAAGTGLRSETRG